MSELNSTDDDEVLWDDEAPVEPVRTDSLGRRLTPERLAALAAGQEKRRANNAIANARRAAGEITRYQQYKQGLLKIEDMDDDEIRKAKWKDLAGSFQGPAQRFTGPDTLTIRRELLKRGQRMLEENYHEALKALTGIAVNPHPLVKEGDQLKAIQMIMERVAGKVPDKVEVGGADAFSDLLQDVIDDGVLKDGADVVPGEVVER